ncbi:MAG: bifunctional protein-disulfide isomerase/oxidoreductase DsbC [Shewanella sp.]
MKFTRIFSLTLAVLLTPFAMAVSNTTSDTITNSAELKQKLSDALSVKVHSLNQSPIPGLYEALTDRGVLYISKDGSKLLHGSLYDLDNGMKNLTEAAMAGPRIEMMKPLEDKMLVYKAKNEKHVVTIFTDISCGYCRKLHGQMAEYNDLGITIRYLAFPRRGIPSANADEMEAVWCADDPLEAMTQAKEGNSIKSKQCDAKIAEQYQLGQSFGINGTPAMILEDGSMIPGYQQPKDLLRALENTH